MTRFLSVCALFVFGIYLALPFIVPIQVRSSADIDGREVLGMFITPYYPFFSFVSNKPRNLAANFEYYIRVHSPLATSESEVRELANQFCDRRSSVVDGLQLHKASGHYQGSSWIPSERLWFFNCIEGS